MIHKNIDTVSSPTAKACAQELCRLLDLWLDARPDGFEKATFLEASLRKIGLELGDARSSNSEAARRMNLVARELRRGCIQV